MRICSFLPSATEIVYALGLGDQLYGVTFECDYPAEARHKPIVVRSVFGEDSSHLSSEEINTVIYQRLQEGLGIYDLDQAVLEAAAPDLLLTQAICEVWAISTRQVAEASRLLPKAPAVVSLDPKCMGDVLGDVTRVAQATGAEAVAAPIVAALQARIDAVQATAARVARKPRVLHLEWAEPPMCGGHWVPEMVEMAGGINCFGDKDQGSFQLDWPQVAASQPDVILLMPCGFDVQRALKDIPVLAAKPGWDTLPAVQQQHVYVIDAGAYTSRSGPRLVDGLELIAELLHPECFTGMIPKAGALRVPDDQLIATSG